MKHERQQGHDSNAVKKPVTPANEACENQSVGFKQSLEDTYSANIPGPKHGIPEDDEDDYEGRPPASERPSGDTPA